MSEIIVQGHKIDTKDIWDIEYNTNSRYVNITIKITDRPDIVIGRSIAYETYSYQFEGINAPYKKLYNELKEKWKADKSDIPVFKL